jgi:hypothetical protein
VPVPPGDVLDDTQVRGLEAAVSSASAESGLCFGLQLGASEGEPRAFAERLLARLPRPADGVLVLIDPVSHRIEIRTGSNAANRLDDRTCGLAAASMASCLAGGDLVGGVAVGLRMLVDHVR